MIPRARIEEIAEQLSRSLTSRSDRYQEAVNAITQALEEARAEAITEHKRLLNKDELSLLIGEMSAQEKRTAVAILKYLICAMQRMGGEV